MRDGGKDTLRILAGFSKEHIEREMF